MSERRNVSIVVFEQKQWDDDWPPKNLAEAILWFQDKLDSVPCEFRDNAVIEIDGHDDGHGASWATMNISYTRPETDAEMRAREMRERADAEWRRQRELAQLQALKAKYGDTA